MLLLLQGFDRYGVWRIDAVAAPNLKQALNLKVSSSLACQDCLGAFSFGQQLCGHVIWHSLKLLNAAWCPQGTLIAEPTTTNVN